MPKRIALLATAVLCALSPVRLVAAADCMDLLHPMATLMQSLRQGATPSPDERQTWRTWNRHCQERHWQNQLAHTLPGGPPAPMVVDTPIYVPPDEPAPARAPQHEVRAYLPRVSQGLRLPMTTCRTTYASRQGRSGAYTTCQTFGGY